MRALSREEFIRELRDRDVKVWVDGDELRVSAPKGVLTGELKDELSRRKAQIMGLLAQADAGSEPPLVSVSPEHAPGGAFPLSFAQERLWLLQQFHAGTTAYHLKMIVPLAYRTEVVRDALHDLVARHAILRTRYGFDDAPVQIVDLSLTSPLHIFDLSALSESEYRAAVKGHAREEERKPFDLGAGPVWRALLLQRGEDRSELLLTIHHIATDGWSMNVLQRDIQELCRARASNMPPRLPALPIQYADFAVWHRRWLDGSRLNGQLAYWTDRLAGMRPAIALPTDRPRPAVYTYEGAGCATSISGPVVTELRALARRANATVFMTLLTVFKAVLARYCGETDIPVGTPIAGRDRSETDNLVGLFLNTLVLRTDLSGDPTFATLLARVRETTLGAFAHQDLPFERLVEALKPERDPSRNPLFQVMFTLMVPTTDRGAIDFNSGIDTSDIAGAQVDLALYAQEWEDRIDLGLAYSTDLFDEGTIKRMLRHFEQALRAAVADPDAPIGRLPLLDDAERQQILVDWNRTDVAYPEERRLHRLIDAQADRTPDAVAVEFGELSLTYGELARRANRLARYLQGLGARPGTLVGVFMERSLEIVVALYGILKAGGAYVPIDPEYPSDRIAFMLQDANAPVLLTQERLRHRLPAGDAAVVALDSQWPVITQESDADMGETASARDLAYVIYTSGSTGRPKGVLNCHQGIANRLYWMQDAFRLTAEDRVLQKTPFSFDVSVWEFFWPLMAGARLVVAAPGGHRDPAYLAQAIRDKAITTLHFVPSMLRAYLDSTDFHAAAHLRRVIVSGEALSYELMERFFQVSRAELHNLYGPTEAAVDVTHWACRRDDARRVVPIGRPIANTRLYILDPALQTVPVGVAGELHIAGVQVAKGYLNRPELTAEKFIRNPFSADPAARMYKTGDLAHYLPDGNIEYLGRIDNQVKLRGFRIELGEIEAVFAGVDGVRAAVVVLREDTPGDARLVVYVVADSAHPPNAEALRAKVAEALPAYMVPSAFVFLDALPLTPSGKVDRKALPALARAAPRAADNDVAAAPGGELEQIMANIWCELLDVDEVRASDMFFDLGGHSLLSIKVVERFERETGVRIAPMDLLNQTLRQIVAGVEARCASSKMPLRPGRGGILTGQIGGRS